jgi:glycosyltransferase involved in cell wall biosynthesis
LGTAAVRKKILPQHLQAAGCGVLLVSSVKAVFHPQPEGASGTPHPRVSVVIPLYNCERYLAECLDSILAQDFRDFEIVVVDDGSTDKSLDIVKTYAAKDARLRWLKNQNNLGLTGNHNACLQAARGEFIKFVHQDDKILHPAALGQMVELLERDATISLVGGGSLLINSQSRPLAARNNFLRDGILDGKDVIVKCLEANKNLIGEPTVVMFRKTQAARGFDPRFRQSVDMEFAFHLLEQGRFAYIAGPLFGYRLHEQQATEKHSRTGADRDEQMLLCEDLIAKPWLAEHATRKMWFKQIYYLRKKFGARADRLVAEARKHLSPLGYALCRLEHVFSEPLRKWQERRVRRRLKL